MQKKPIHKEILIYVVVIVLWITLFSLLDAYERFHEFSRKFEYLELDEIALAVPILLLCMIYFGWRRTVELRRSTHETLLSREKLQKAYNKIRELTQSREEFMAVACHELKSPLAGVTSALRMVKDVDNLLEAQELVELSLEGLENLQMLVNDVLYFSNLTHAGQLLEKSPFSPRNTLESIMSLGRVSADEKKLKFLLSVEDNVPETVIGYEGWVRLVTLNLVNNALKFTLSGSVHIRCGFHVTDKLLIIKVEDTGPGIPEDQFERIFEPYEKGVHRHHGNKEGMGLGLSVVRKLVDRIGGAIVVNSKLDRGSTFTVRIPVRLPEA